MTRKLKVVTVVGTRPEIIRLSRVIPALDRHCDHILIHTGQNYDFELNDIFFSELGIRKPDVFLGASGATGAETIGKVIIGVDGALSGIAPDALLVLGDTNSCMAVIPAKRRRIPIFHMEAGNRCFDMRVPEEINRRIVDHTADVNLPYSDIAREYLLREGLRPDLIIKTGSPMMEVLGHYRGLIDSSLICEHLGLSNERFFVVSFHREENVDREINIIKINKALNRIAEIYDIPIIVSTHPRTRKRIEALNLRFDPRVRLLKPLGLPDYVKLQMNARAVLSDSGTITEESSILNLREAHERPEGMEEAAVMMVGLELDRIMQGLEILRVQARESPRSACPVMDYRSHCVSDKIVKIIHSYVDYVQRIVWRKEI